MISLRFESHLVTDVATLWQHASSMAGVNFELMPLVRMTYPADRAALPHENIPKDVLFQSWLMLFGILPFDRHALRLTNVWPRQGFDEDSTSWLQSRWIHKRRLIGRANGVTVTDELEITPRVRFAAPIVAAMVTQIFRHRHRRLRRRFGTGS
ncbi:MAG: hypothetical protein M3O62_09035 [Pseudomonadota bacterium]|nr:hypothetical protein [Pseudomonadota bacterium]